uniref:Uncharacterized protein n=1 Tax=Oryza glumipatula TaxID=40148 RepID=A0A0D9YHR2_9ORYZ
MWKHPKGRSKDERASQKARQYDVWDGGSCPTRRITPLSFLHTYHAAEKESPTTERMIGGGD